jgi:hypothetical protein
MNRIEMRNELRRAGIADGLYELTGIHFADRYDLGTYFLEEQGGKWVVGVEERGKRESGARFDTEDEACRYLYDQLTAPPPPVYMPTPEEEERGDRITKEEVNRFWQDREVWLRRMRGQSSKQRRSKLRLWFRR